MISLERMLSHRRLLRLKEIHRIRYLVIIHGLNRAKDHYNLFKNLVQLLKCFLNFINH